MDTLYRFYHDVLAYGGIFNIPIVVVVISNILLIIFSSRILNTFYHIPKSDSRFTVRLYVFRGLNLLIIFAFIYYQMHIQDNEKVLGLNLVLILFIFYLSYLCIHISNYVIRVNYGKFKDNDGKTQFIETYSSRLIGYIASVLIIIIGLISVVRLLGFDSLLEAGGVIGFIGVILALTQGAWAPDLFSGLIMLNSRMVEVGDVIEISESGENIIGTIYKTKPFHTEILNLVNNHRIMIKNARLRECIIQNLSKFASAKGLREKLIFKIDYAISEIQVKKMFQTAYDRMIKNPMISIEGQYPLEIAIENTGDYAIEWVVYYYTKHVRHLIHTRQLVREQILLSAREFEISLATPLIAQISGTIKS